MARVISNYTSLTFVEKKRLDDMWHSVMKALFLSSDFHIYIYVFLSPVFQYKNSSHMYKSDVNVVWWRHFRDQINYKTSVDKFAI